MVGAAAGVDGEVVGTALVGRFLAEFSTDLIASGLEEADQIKMA